MRTRGTTTKRRARGEHGIVLVAVLLVMMLMLGMGAAIHGGIIGDVAQRGAHARGVAGFYAAEAGINKGMATYRDIFLDYRTPTGGDFNLNTLTIGPRTVKYQLGLLPGYPTTGYVPAGQNFAGLQAITYRYTANSKSEITSGDTEVSLGTEFDVTYIPLFQFLAFYQKDLEIEPGPAMTLHGPIHTNGSLYLNSNNTEKIVDNPPTIQRVQITTAGDVWRGRKDTSDCGGTVTISQLTTTQNHTTALPTQNMNCSGASRVKQTSAQLASWLGSIRARIPSIAVPQPSTLARGAADPTSNWQNADLRIVLDVNAADADANGLHPIVVQGANGVVDTVLTQRLWQFMQLNPGRVFYNDVPKNDSVTGTCTVNGSAQNTGPVANKAYCLRTQYTPNFNTVFGGENNGYVYPCTSTAFGAAGGTWDCSGGNAMTTMTGISFPGFGAGTGVTARRGGFYNNREHRWVYMLNLNLHDLLVWNRAQPSANRLFDPDDTSDGGLVIFLSVMGPLSNSMPGVTDPSYGVRVFGSPNFDFPPAADPTGVTIASDNAAYVQGNYNVDAAAAFYDPTHPKMPASVIADTINVLSAVWEGNPTSAPFNVTQCRNDCQSHRSLAAERPANSATVNTTYMNVAFLGGVDDTVGGTTASPGTYNGGFENYPRFHEDWSAATLLYRGSFVTLGNPLHANGTWCGTGGSQSNATGVVTGCNMYNPPTRNWDYDTDFQRVENLPPLSPRVMAVEQILFTENFR